MTTPTTPDKRPPTVMAVELNDSKYRLEDLPLEVVDKIAKECEVSWMLVVQFPLSDLVVAARILQAVCEREGVEMPTGLTPRSIVTYFIPVPDDMGEPNRLHGEDEDDDPFRSSGNAT